jgi:hypothetical protein
MAAESGLSKGILSIPVDGVAPVAGARIHAASHAGRKMPYSVKRNQWSEMNGPGNLFTRLVSGSR